MKDIIGYNSCKNCAFNYGGECHRYPPKLIATNSTKDYYLDDGHKVIEVDHDPIWAFPQIGDSDWCGEWKLDEGV